MARSRITVVLSQGQSQNPAKRNIEEELAAALLVESGVELSIVPHLYDLTDDHTGMLFLRSVRTDMVVLSWIYPRAAHWVLDRWGVQGHVGTVLLKKPSNDDDEEEEAEDDNGADEAAGDKRPAVGAGNVPDRRIYCLDLRDFDSAGSYLTRFAASPPRSACRRSRSGLPYPAQRMPRRGPARTLPVPIHRPGGSPIRRSTRPPIPAISPAGSTARRRPTSWRATTNRKSSSTRHRAAGIP